MNMEYTQPQFILDIEQAVEQATIYDKSKSDQHGEVFTPPELINEMLDQIPVEVWSDSTKTFFDPCAGKGQFPIQIIKRLMAGLQNQFTNEEDRYKHIMENQLYMSEYQKESADYIQEHFSLHGKVKINLHQGDTLTMSNSYFENKKKGKEIVDAKSKFFSF